jgi:hypothetical protein
VPRDAATEKKGRSPVDAGGRSRSQLASGSTRVLGSGAARAVLVDRLSTARKDLRPIRLAQAQRIGGSLADVPRSGAFRMLSQIAQDRLDEVVVGGDRDCLCPVARAQAEELAALCRALRVTPCSSVPKHRARRRARRDVPYPCRCAHSVLLRLSGRASHPDRRPRTRSPARPNELNDANPLRTAGPFRQAVAVHPDESLPPRLVTSRTSAETARTDLEHIRTGKNAFRPCWEASLQRGQSWKPGQNATFPQVIGSRVGRKASWTCRKTSRTCRKASRTVPKLRGRILNFGACAGVPWSGGQSGLASALASRRDPNRLLQPVAQMRFRGRPYDLIPQTKPASAASRRLPGAGLQPLLPGG